MRHGWLHDASLRALSQCDGCIGFGGRYAGGASHTLSTSFIFGGVASSATASDPKQTGRFVGVDDQAEDDAAARKSIDEVECDWAGMELGNQPGVWKVDQASMKYAYDHNLQGEEISVWWIGKSKQGECNDLDDPSRNCWYRSRMLNDVSCNAEKGHCLHFVSHDGMNRHNFTCPTWVKDAEGRRCKLPEGWQACPRKFTVQRVDGGVPQSFKAALSQMCPKGPKEEFKKEVGQAKQEVVNSLHPDEQAKFEKVVEEGAQRAQEEATEDVANEPTATSNLEVSTNKALEKLQESREELTQRSKALQAQVERTAGGRERMHEEAAAVNEPKAEGFGKRPNFKRSHPLLADEKEVGLPKKNVDPGVPEDDKPVTERLMDKVKKGEIDEQKRIIEQQKTIEAMPPKEQEMAKAIGEEPDEDSAVAEKKQIDLAYKVEAEGQKAFEAPEPSGGCLGATGATDGIEGKDVNMIFDVHNNRWYRCTQEMLCENYFISGIRDGEGVCGDSRCGPDESCFTHRISSKRHTTECVPTEQVWVISDSDDKAKVETVSAASPWLAGAIAQVATKRWKAVANARWVCRTSAFL